LKVSHSSGSSTQKRPHEKRGRSLIQNESDLLDTDLLPIRAAVENPPVACEAAPTGCPVVICFASCIGSSRGLELSTNRKSAPLMWHMKDGCSPHFVMYLSQGTLNVPLTKRCSVLYNVAL
jgi:hypothetical protein